MGRSSPYLPYSYYSCTGGGGGAGGGFIDITSAKTIRVFGTIDASGGKGGSGASYYYSVSAGGGGGSGGGVRLLTPGEVQLSSTTVINVGGGAGGVGGLPMSGVVVPRNDGGRGANGRLVIETKDSLVTGIGTATLTPGEGAAGFYRGLFDATRFQGGGLRPVVVTDVMDMGPASPVYAAPVQAYPPLSPQDFVAGIPAVSSRGIAQTGIYLEAQGFPAKADGSIDVGGASGWKSVGYLVDSGAELYPTWVPNARPPSSDVPAAQLQPGSTANPFTELSGLPFVRFRISYFLSPTVGPNDPGPYVDRWVVRVGYDQ
jgi:hypothetical protein